VNRFALPDWGWSLFALLSSLLILVPLALIAGADPAQAYREIIDESFGSLRGFGVMLQYAVPLILVGLGVALPFRAGLFNIGGEGQIVMGAFLAVLVAVKCDFLGGLPASFLFPLVAAVFGGALVGGIAGALKAWRGTNEIITTIMLNFVALLFVQYWISGPFQAENASYATSPLINRDFELVRFGGTDRLPSSLWVALLAAVVLAIVVHWSRVGWRMTLAGTNPGLAARQGISVRLVQLCTLAAGGALAGLGGGAEALGNQYKIGESFSPGWGFDAIAIAVLARGNMLAVVPYALFFAFLRNGSGPLQTDLGVPPGIVTMLAGAPVIVVAALQGMRIHSRLRTAGA
jgi:general nucleoside transport system permease protein